MHRLRSFAVRFLNYFRRSRVEADLSAQLETHQAILEEHFVGEGMTESEARIAAGRAMGNGMLARELTRNERFFESVDTFLRDIRLAARRLRRSPTLTVLSIASLASGIGAAAVAYSLVSAVSLSPLPRVDTDRLFALDRPAPPDLGFTLFTMPRTYGEYLWLKDLDVFDQVAAGRPGEPSKVESEKRGISVEAMPYFATSDFFRTLGVPLGMGRTFSPTEDAPGAPLVVVLSESLWRTAFASDPEILGRAIRIGDQSAVVIGVTTRGFRGIEVGASPDLYLPLHGILEIGPEVFARQGAGLFSSTTFSGPLASSWLDVFGRLSEEREREEVEAILNDLSPDLHSDDATAVHNWSLLDINTAALPQLSREGMSQFSTLLGATVGFLLLVGCLAVGMLLLVRTEDRRDEFAACLALGAPRYRLARGVAMEGMMLALAGGVLSLLVAHWLFASVVAFELPGNLPIEDLGLSLDSRALLAAAAAAVGAVVLISTIAASFCFSVDTADSLHRSAATRHTRRGRLRSVLVVGQVGVALVLLAGTGLFARTLSSALDINPGVDIGRVVFADVVAGGAGYSPREADVFFDRVRERLSEHPDVDWVVAGSWAGTMARGGETFVDGRPLRLPAGLSRTVIHDGYFATMGGAIFQGREFTRAERENAFPVAIVSPALGRLISRDGSPVGHSIRAPYARGDTDYEIVGVASDLVRAVGSEDDLVVFFPDTSEINTGRQRTLFVRSAREDVAPVVRAITAAVDEIDANVGINRIQTVEEQILGQMSAQRFGMTAMGGLAAIAVLLTTVGIYVLAESLANGRRRELGIRAALGATRWQLGTAILSETTRLVGIGILLGLGLVWMGSGMIRAFLFGIGPMDPATLFGASALVLVLVAAAGLKPVSSVMRMDVSRTLREE